MNIIYRDYLPNPHPRDPLPYFSHIISITIHIYISHHLKHEPKRVTKYMVIITYECPKDTLLPGLY